MLKSGGSMHELSLCESVVRIIADEAERQSFSRVLKVRLEIGALSCAMPDAMRMAFTAVTPGTIAEGAVLEILHTPGVAHCEKCGKDVEVSERYDPCPDCGTAPLFVTNGDQLRIKDLEVE